MDIAQLARIVTSIAFFVLAGGGTWALFKLNRFIREYRVAHKTLNDDHNKLKNDHEALKVRVARIEKTTGNGHGILD